jgi:nucleoside-diphosphate-sugar epimerase
VAANRSVLLVGGAGFLGSVLTGELLARGYAVTILDRLFFGQVGIEPYRDRVRLLPADIRNLGVDCLQGVAAIINLSGLSNDPTAEYNPEANYQMNTLATATLAQLAKQCGVRRYIYASSCSVYDFGIVDAERDVLMDETSTVDPRAAYSKSKYDGERALLALIDDSFCPVILRMGTLYGFSPRMRYDLVVNTFVKDALSKGYVTLHYGGQMWRPLAEVRDAARAYVALLEAPEDAVRGEIFNLVHDNYRISELALRVRDALADLDIDAEIRTDFKYAAVRNYRVSGRKITQALNFRLEVGIEDSVRHIVENVRAFGYMNFDHDRYYNIRWMRLLEEAQSIINITGGIFDSPAPKALG